MHGVQVQYLVRELRSHMPHGTAKKPKKTKKIPGGSIIGAGLWKEGAGVFYK